MINIVIPMAGEGSRFSNAGYKTPKPFLDIHGSAMISVVLKNLSPNVEHQFILLTRRGNEASMQTAIDKAERDGSVVRIIYVEELTEGAACTVLLAREYIDNEEQLMIANSDQWVDCNINDYLSRMAEPSIDGLVMTMTADDPKWSFCEVDNNGYIVRIVEKEVISDIATVGIYNFRSGRDFVRAADEMIRKDLRVNGEFYVAPVYNQLIEEGQKFVHWGVGSEGNGMYGLGIPSDYEKFLSSPISLIASNH